jgi:hypothetical protein
MKKPKRLCHLPLFVLQRMRQVEKEAKEEVIEEDAEQLIEPGHRSPLDRSVWREKPTQRGPHVRAAGNRRLGCLSSPRVRACGTAAQRRRRVAK